MAVTNPNQINQGAFVPTTSVWDVAPIYATEVTSPEFKELLVRLYQNINNIAINLNIKDIGTYDLQEIVNGQKFFKNPALGSTTSQNPTFRQVFRTVVNFGALPDNTTKSVPHYINPTNNYTFTRIYGTATNTSTLSYLPLPYASVSGNPIEINADSTNVNIITGYNYSAYNMTYVILEYIKQ